MVSHIRPDSDDLPLDERVRALLAAAAAPTEPGPVAGEAEALAAFRTAHRRSRRIAVLGRLTPARTAVAATIGAGAFLAAGIGAAAAGTLPGAAQDTARDWLGTVGIEVPGAHAHAAGHADQRGGSGTEDAETEAGTEAPETETDETADDTEAGEADDAGTDAAPAKELPPAAAHGQEVSGLAKSTDAEGAAKGAEISGTASGGRSKAGERRDDSAGDARPSTEGDEGSGAADPAKAGRRP